MVEPDTAPQTPDEDELIARWIKPNRYRPSEMVLTEYGTAVWALVGFARDLDDPVRETASAYKLPPDAVRAALAYYRRHPLQIDAKLEANALAHAAQP